MSQPIKRNPALQPLSRDHHHGLLLGWKIRKGFENGTDPARIMNYAKWFYTEHLIPHFNAEENLLFPILGNDHPLIAQALQEHRSLTTLFSNETDVEENLHRIEKELDAHIRFEERVLFNEIEKVATPEQMQMISSVHKEEIFCENEEVKFW